MTAAVSHSERSGAHLDELDYLPAVQFSVDSLGIAHGGAGSSPDMDWDLPDELGEHDGGLTAGTGNIGSAGGGELCFDDFLDLDGLAHTGDELTHGMPDSFYFDLGPIDGSVSATSASDDLDELFSCHSSQQQQPLYQAPPAVGTRSSATADSAATILAARGFPSSIPPPARTQSSSAIDRAPGEQRKQSTHPAAPLGPDSFESISDSELLRLEGISLKASPSRPPPLGPVSQSQPPTPHLAQRGEEGPALDHSTLPATNKSARRPATSTTNFFKAVASKIQQKAATVRSSKASTSSQGRKPGKDPQEYNSNMTSLAVERPISPASSPSKHIKREPQHHHQMAMTANPRLPISPPNSATIPQGMSASFGNGMLEDPFGGVPVGQVHGMYRRPGQHTPLDTPIMDDDDKNDMYFSPSTTAVSSHEAAHTSKAAWPSSQGDSQASFAWANSFSQPDGSLEGAQWWDSTVDVNTVNSHFQAQNARNASFNMALHGGQSHGNDMPYAYGGNHIPVSAGQDMSGIMLSMPNAAHHSRSSSSPAIHNGAYTHLPPQQHQQQHHIMTHQHPGSQTERRPRMPRAPSAGARHLQTPMRRQRPSSRSRARDSSSASPTPQARSRHSSGSSAAGGPVLASSIKKRRSFNSTTRHHPRTPSGGSSVGLGIDLSSGGGGGFVNFTPSDKNVLMTGVAPSGSSKTKARREKEAQEKRRRMSEAAIKAVRDAGGDVDQLMQDGFQF